MKYLKYVFYGLIAIFIIKIPQQILKDNATSIYPALFFVGMALIFIAKFITWAIVTSHIADLKGKDTFWSFILGGVFGIFAALFYSFSGDRKEDKCT